MTGIKKATWGFEVVLNGCVVARPRNRGDIPPWAAGLPWVVA